MGKDASALVLLALLMFGILALAGPAMGRAEPVSLISHAPVDPVHRTYWLIGNNTLNANNQPSNWNNTGSNPGPLVAASDGDNVTIMLQSGDSVLHNWYLDFNKDFVLDSNEIVSTSPGFTSPTSWLNWTFAVHLGSVPSGGSIPQVGIPHGGTFYYRCQYHAAMYGNFKFNSGPLASFSHLPTTPLVGHQASFDASTSWPSTNSTSITFYSWVFGDGNQGTGATVTHSYSTNKTYTVILNVTDNLLQSAVASQSVTVLNPPPVPFDFSIQVTPLNAKIVQAQTANATVSLNLTSGASENVTLSSTVSPYDPSITISVNGSASTSGFPSYSASMKIVTTSITPNGTYTVTVIALSSTGVAHNATFALILTPLPPACAGCPLRFGYIIYGAIVFAFVLAVILVYWRSRKKMSMTRAEASSLTLEGSRRLGGVLYEPEFFFAGEI